MILVGALIDPVQTVEVIDDSYVSQAFRVRPTNSRFRTQKPEWARNGVEDVVAGLAFLRRRRTLPGVPID